MEQEHIELLADDKIPEPIRASIAQSMLNSADERRRHEIETGKLKLEQRKFLWNTPIVAALASLVTLSATFIFDRISSREETQSTITLEQVRQEIEASEARLTQQLEEKTTKTVAEIEALAREREFQYKIVEAELAKDGKSNEQRAAVLLFLAKAGVLSTLNADELQRMAEQQINNPDEEIIPQLAAESTGSISSYIYGDYFYDNYPPWSYQQIFANSKSVVALAEPGQSQALCSGVLIARDLVLTAGNCLRGNRPEHLQVWFGFVQAADGQLPPPVSFDIIELVAPPSEQHHEFLERAAEGRFDAEVLDYAIVRFDPEGGDGLSTEVAPQCLRDANVRRGRPVYVIGYPKGTRETVHDGRVYLPFRLRPVEFEELKMEIEVDFADSEDAERLRMLNEFTASYVERQHGATTVFELHDTRFGGQPKIGIVADTFTGNSGSPVYDRDDHCIVGILTGGAPDFGQPQGASWQFHETVLPMPAILSDLQQHPRTATLLEDGFLIIR